MEGKVKNDGSGIVLIAPGAESVVNEADEIEWQFADYCAAFLQEPVGGHLASVLKRDDVHSLHDAVELGHVTRGQWLIWVIREFRGQMMNGGMAQFLVNCEDLIGDVASALKLLELDDFADAYLALVEPLIDDLDQHRRSAGGLPVVRQVRALFRDHEAVRRKVLEDAAGSQIDEHFIMKWDEERGALCWPPDCWSQQMLTRAVGYIKANRREFQHLAS